MPSSLCSRGNVWPRGDARWPQAMRPVLPLFCNCCPSCIAGRAPGGEEAAGGAAEEGAAQSGSRQVRTRVTGPSPLLCSRGFIYVASDVAIGARGAPGVGSSADL